MSKDRMIDRRTRLREATYNCATIEVHGGNDQALGVVLNISSKGLGLRTGQPPEPGDAVTLRVLADEDIHEVGAHVVHISQTGNDEYVVGLAYDQERLQADPLLESIFGEFRDE